MRNTTQKHWLTHSSLVSRVSVVRSVVWSHCVWVCRLQGLLFAPWAPYFALWCLVQWSSRPLHLIVRNCGLCLLCAALHCSCGPPTCKADGCAAQCAQWKVPRTDHHVIPTRGAALRPKRDQGPSACKMHRGCGAARPAPGRLSCRRASSVPGGGMAHWATGAVPSLLAAASVSPCVWCVCPVLRF